MDDIQTLTELTTKINDSENQGDRQYLSGILAPRLAFQRGDLQRTVDDQVAFLQKVQPAEPGHERTLVKIGPIHLDGNQAAVSCIIRVGGQDYRNLRLFVKRDEIWKLLGWANDAV
jgi:hypothetical protein